MTELKRDIHCVTKWTKFDTDWQGVLFDDILAAAGLATPPTDYRARPFLRRLHDQRAGQRPRSAARRWWRSAYDGLADHRRSWRPGAAAGAASLFLEVGQMGERAAVHRSATSPASGSCAAITCTAIRGASSASPATDGEVDGSDVVPGGRLAWQEATVVAIRPQTPRVKSFLLKCRGWRGFRAGQHVDVRLTAPDGYQAERSYSIGSAPDGADDRTDRRAPRRRRGLALLPRGRPARRHDRAARADRRPFHLGAQGWRAASCWSAAAPAWCRCCRCCAIAPPSRREVPAVLVYSARARDELIDTDELLRRAESEANFSLFVTLTRESAADGVVPHRAHRRGSGRRGACRAAAPSRATAMSAARLPSSIPPHGCCSTWTCRSRRSRRSAMVAIRRATMRPAHRDRSHFQLIQTEADQAWAAAAGSRGACMRVKNAPNRPATVSPKEMTVFHPAKDRPNMVHSTRRSGRP